jgi:3-hydroxy-9,10-secoandrosta-1,3,5(10)-triene-9,17-dione monooxygenase reductase component
MMGTVQAAGPISTAKGHRIDPQSDSAGYRKLLGHVPTSVAVITAQLDSGPAGLTVGTFTSVSLDPPLVAFFVDLGSTTWPQLSTAERLGINILRASQGELCRSFSRRSENRFEGVGWTPSETGVPLLDDALLTLECTQHRVDEIGDHYLVVCRVESVSLQGRENQPLIFLRGGFLDLDADDEREGSSR